MRFLSQGRLVPGPPIHPELEPGPFHSSPRLAVPCETLRTETAGVGLAYLVENSPIHRYASPRDMASASSGQASRTILQSRRASPGHRICLESQSVSQLSGGGSPGDDGVFMVVIEGVCLRLGGKKGLH